MAYLYQSINKIPGLTGTAFQRQKQLYERMGSPYGPYKGSAQQNNYLTTQINSGKATQSVAPKPAAPAQPQAAAPVAANIAQKFANQAGADSVYKGPVFGEVLPFYKAWEGLLPMVEGEANAEINPSMQRQLRQASEGLYNQMSNSGAGRFGSSWGQLGTAQASNEQSRRSQVLDWMNQRRQGFKQLWYDPSEQAFNKAIELGQTPTSPKAPTYEDYAKTFNINTGNAANNGNANGGMVKGIAGPGRPQDNKFSFPPNPNPQGADSWTMFPKQQWQTLLNN